MSAPALSLAAAMSGPEEDGAYAVAAAIVLDGRWVVRASFGWFATPKEAADFGRTIAVASVGHRLIFESHSLLLDAPSVSDDGGKLLPPDQRRLVGHEALRGLGGSRVEARITFMVRDCFGRLVLLPE